MTGSRGVRGRRLFSDRRGRRSLQVYTMRTLVRERDGYREANKSLVGVGASTTREQTLTVERKITGRGDLRSPAGVHRTPLRDCAMRTPICERHVRRHLERPGSPGGQVSPFA